jgi:3-phytase
MSCTSLIVTAWIMVVLALTTAVAPQRPLSVPPVRADDRGTGERSAIQPAFSGTVLPSVETDPSHHPGDTADDMAIWIHPSDPSLSLVIGDDKEGGLIVWGLDGRERQYVDGNLYNNVDLRYNFPLTGTFETGESHTNVSLVGVSNQGDGRFDFFKVNPNTRLLEPVGGFNISITPYGGCMYFSVLTGKYYFIAPDFSGVTEQWEVYDNGAGQVGGTRARTFAVGSITEGCVADDLLGYLYMAEETKGLWKYGAEPEARDARTLVDSTNGGNLVADVEGLSIYDAGPALGYLFASSQGESKVAVYTREDANTFLGKFDVGANGTIDAVTGTDGLDITNFPLAGPFGTGLFVIHDTANSGSNASNLKLVGYGGMADILGLAVDVLWDPRLVGAIVLPLPPFDFAVSVDPTAGTVEPGGTVIAAVSATLVAGSPQTVQFSCANLPAGAACTFAPPTCSPTCGASLSLTTDPTTPEGTYSIRVEGSDGNLTRTATFVLMVRAPPPPRVPTSLLLDPEEPDPSRPGETVTVSFVLLRNDTQSPLAGMSVGIEGSDDGGMTWWPAGTFTTDNAGRANGTIVFLHEGQDQRIRARFDGDATFSGSVSNEESHRTRADIPPPPPNPSPPTARFTFTPAEPHVGDAVAFDASASTSDPGTTLQARWDWDGNGLWDTPLSSNLRETHSFPAVGTYSVVLEVRDSNGLSDTDTQAIDVRPPPDTSPPVASIMSPENGSTFTESRVTFTGTAEDDQGVAEVDLSTDGHTWIPATGTSTWTATLVLSNGTTTVYARATDTAGNERIVSIRVTVEIPETPPSGPSSSGPDLLVRSLPVVGGTVIGVALLGFAAVLVLRMRWRPRSPSRSEGKGRPPPASDADAPVPAPEAANGGANPSVARPDPFQGETTPGGGPSRNGP